MIDRLFINCKENLQPCSKIINKLQVKFLLTKESIENKVEDRHHHCHHQLWSRHCCMLNLPLNRNIFFIFKGMNLISMYMASIKVHEMSWGNCLIRSIAACACRKRERRMKMKRICIIKVQDL